VFLVSTLEHFVVTLLDELDDELVLTIVSAPVTVPTLLEYFFQVV